MEWGTVGIKLVSLFLPEPGLHILAEGNDLAKLWQGVVFERVESDPVVETLRGT